MANYRSNDGYIKDTTGVYVSPPSPAGLSLPSFHRGTDLTPYKDWSVRTKLKLQATDNLSVLVGYQHHFLADPTTEAWYFSSYAAVPPDPGVGSDRVSQSVPPIFQINSDEVTAKVKLTTPIGDLTSYSSYSSDTAVTYSDFDGGKSDVVTAAGANSDAVVQQTLDYNITAIDRLNLIVGGNYFDDESKGGNFTYFHSVQGNATKTDLITHAYAAYVDGTYQILDHLFLSAGLRYSSEHKSLTDVFGCCGKNGVAVFPGQPAEKTWTNLSPRATLRYEVASNSSVYASFSKGFKSGAFDVLVTSPLSYKLPPVQPETVKAYEIGFKTAQHSWRFDTAAFYYDYDNLQLQQTLFQPNGALGAVLENAARSKIYGLEATFGFSPIDALNLQISPGYLHARYKSYPSGTAALVVNNRIVSGTEDFSGRQVVRSPNFTLNVSGDYTIPMGAGSLSLAANLYFTTSYTPSNPSYDPTTGRALFLQDAYSLMNTSLTWNAPGDRIAVTGYVNNIYDTRYKLRQSYSTLGAYYMLSPPTTFGLKVSYSL
jgi:iron complex outermembrane receptor protein